MGASKEMFIEQREYAMLDELSVQELRNNVIVKEGVNYAFKESYQSIFEKFEKGVISAIECYGMLKQIENDFKEKLSIVQIEALQEVENKPKNFVKAGFSFEKRQGRATYNFKGIEEWDKLTEKRKNLENLSKQAFYNYSKGLNVDVVDSETGEIIPLPKVTYSSDVLIVKRLD